jgi:hypothetical protein
MTAQPNKYGVVVLEPLQVMDLMMQQPSHTLEGVTVTNDDRYNSGVAAWYSGHAPLTVYTDPDCTVQQFDQQNQARWHMPQQYLEWDVVGWLLSQCQTPQQTQRVQQELDYYRQNNLLPLLQYVKYLVDTMQQHGIVWGVGRGSSVASYVLYLLGLHRVDSLLYDLPIQEFFKEDSHEESL